MESGQEITVDAWVELESQLAEVRAKRDQLDAQNLRVTDNLKRTIEERDKAVLQLESLRAEYLAAKEASNANSDQAASLREQLQEMRAQRDTLGRYRDEMRVSRDESRKASADLRAELERAKATHNMLNRMIEALRGDCDAVKEELAHAKETADMFEQENVALRDTIRTLRAKQVHPDLPGLLEALRVVVEQARELI